MPAGRPTKYREEYVTQGYKLALLGATDAEMAGVWGVDETTINEWKKVHPDFSQSINDGKLAADAEIAGSLYRRAKGYSHPDVHISSYEGEITITDIVKHYPPDTQAASLWLRNRQSSKWRDKQELEHAGPGGAPLIPDAPDPHKVAQALLSVIRGAREEKK